MGLRPVALGYRAMGYWAKVSARILGFWLGVGGVAPSAAVYSPILHPPILNVNSKVPPLN